MTKNDDDCPYKLIRLIDKPKQWRMTASEVLIKLYEDSDTNKKILYAVLTLLSVILTAIIYSFFA